MVDTILFSIILLFSTIGVCRVWDLLYQYLLRPKKTKPMIVILSEKDKMAPQQALLLKHQWKHIIVYYQ